MQSLVHYVGISFINIFCHTFCYGFAELLLFLHGTPSGLTVNELPLIIGVIVIGSKTTLFMDLLTPGLNE